MSFGFTGLAKAMNDFIESMERIRTLQGTTQEQWDKIAQGILAIVDTEGVRDETLPNKQDPPESGEAG